VPTELSTHPQGQLIAVHPAYDLAFDGFAPQGLRRKPKSRQEWAASQLTLATARFIATTPGNDSAKGVPKRRTGEKKHQRKYRPRRRLNPYNYLHG
jgi:hypothetical protein